MIFPPGITFSSRPQLAKIEHGHLIYEKLLKLIYYTFWVCWVLSVGWCITIVHMLVVNCVFMGYTANQHKKLQYIGSTETGIWVLLACGKSNEST